MIVESRKSPAAQSTGRVNSRWVIDQPAPRRDTQTTHRAGPRCGGGNLGDLPQGRPRRGQAAAPLVLLGDDSSGWTRRYSPFRKRDPSRSASREAEGTGPETPRQPARRARCQARPGDEPGRMCRASSGGDGVSAPTAQRNRFVERIEQGPAIVGDGGMGALLGAAVPRLRCPEEANLRAPDAVVSLHVSFINAGAELIETNTFGANRRKLAAHFLEDETERINSTAVKLAREAREIAGRDVFIGGSIGPLGEPATSRVRRELFAEQATVLEGRGADLFMVETFYDLEELTDAVEAVRSVSSLPVVALLTFDEGAETLAGITAREAAERLVQLDLTAIGANH